MAFVHGKSAVFKIDNAGGGSLTDISTYVDSVEGLPGEREIADVTTLGQTGHKSVPGLVNGTFTIGGPWDATLDAIMGVLQVATATATFEHGPAGSTTGLVRYTGECWVTSYTVSTPVGDKVSWTASVQVDGDVTRNTF